MASKLQLEEMETHLNLTADNRTEWEVYSDDPMMQKKFDKIAQPYKTVGKGKWYRIDAAFITIKAKRRTTKKPVDKTELSERMKKMRAARQNDTSV